MALTKQDIKSLRSASRLTFNIYEGRPSIRAIKEVKEGAFTAEAEYRIDCLAGIGCPGCYSEYSIRNFRCYHMVHFNDGNQFQTIWKHLREGDEICLIWGENGNGYTSRHGLCADYLHLEIRRGGMRETYFIGVSICPDNSARMIKSL